MLKIFLIVPLLLLFTSCEYISTEGEVNNNTKYPSKVGYEWEYNTTWKLELYDTLGNIDSTSFQNLGNTIVRVTKERDVVGTFTELIRFESYDLATSQNINITWYMNNDSGFYAVAYYNPGVSQPVLPKQKTLAIEQLKKLIKSVGLLPNASNLVSQLSNTTDSIQHYSPIRKVLSYPVKIGSRWVELVEPFFREKFINEQKIISTNWSNYNCYKIESKWSWFNLEYNDYVNLNSGLIQRELIADSMMLTTVTNPDSGSYVKSTTISKLVRENQ